MQQRVSDTGRFEFRLPRHWRSPVEKNAFASEAERQVLEWFGALGLSDVEIARARRFDTGGYVGMPFPFAPLDKTVRMAKFLALWLLWDDVGVEARGNRWRIDAADVLARSRFDGMSRFDEGLWELLQEFSASRSPRWIEEFCRAMSEWNAAAVEEAAAMEEHLARGTLPAFDEQLALRIRSIGMEPVMSLIEDARDFEPPAEFHANPAVQRLKVVADHIVALGNEVLSFGKDHSEGHWNLATTLMRERGVPVEEAVERLVRMHNAAVEEYDRIAGEVILQASAEASDWTARWFQDLRFALLGLGLWEAQAPRYTAHKVVSRGIAIEPRFRFV